MRSSFSFLVLFLLAAELAIAEPSEAPIATLSGSGGNLVAFSVDGFRA